MVKREGNERTKPTPTLTAEYVSVVDMLPPEAQRVVNERLPYLEALADAEVEQFGRRLANALCDRVRELAEVEKRTGQTDLKRICEEYPTTEQRVQAEKGTRDAIAELLGILAETQASAGHESQASAVRIHMDPLRDAVRQLRGDIAAGKLRSGMDAFETAFDSWWARSAGDAVEFKEGDKDALEKATKALATLIGESVAIDEGGTPLAGHGDVAVHIEDVARKANELHERAREASRRPASEDRSSSEFVARRLDELDWQLKQALGEDLSDAMAGIRIGVGSAKRAALHLDRQVRTQPLGVLEAWLNASGAGAGDRPTIEDARIACAKAHAFYEAPGALAQTLADVGEENAVLGRQLEALAVQREREHRNRALEASVNRLEHLVEQTARRLETRAARARAQVLERKVETARTTLGALTKATEAMIENVIAAAGVVSAGRRFLREREESSEAICRAVADTAKTVGLASSGAMVDQSAT